MSKRPFPIVVLCLLASTTFFCGGCAPLPPPSSAGPSGSATPTGAKAQFMRAQEYYEAGNYAEAAKWYRQAADQGAGPAQYNLGLMYQKGEGVPQDYAEAAKWYRQAADQGDANAQHSLGIQYYRGEGVPQDYAEAAKWFRRAANHGDANAQAILGFLYRDGKGVSRDDVQAYTWFNLAAVTLSPGPDRDKTVKARDALAARMTPAQLAATQKPPAEAQQHYRVALVALKNNDLDIAAEELEKAAKVPPSNASILYSLAVVQSKQGYPTRAMPNLQRARQLGLPPEEREAADELEITLTYQTRKQQSEECPEVNCNCGDTVITKSRVAGRCLTTCADICKAYKETEANSPTCPQYNCRCNSGSSPYVSHYDDDGCWSEEESCYEACKDSGGWSRNRSS